MKPHGLIPDEWLVSYAAGSLSEEHALLVATHAHYQPDLQEKIMDAEAIGGALLEDIDPVSFDGAALDRVMESLDSNQGTAETNHETNQPVERNGDVDLAPCLQEYLGQPLDSLKWRTMGPGMKNVKLSRGPNGENLWLLKARGGTHMPEHGHNGAEMTLVLRGGYTVDGKHYGPGFMEIADTDVENHRPIIDEGADCICLVVTHAPLRMKSLIGKVMQPFIGL